MHHLPAPLSLSCPSLIIQVAQQQGIYLAELFANNKITGNPATTVMKPGTRPFGYFHKVWGPWV